MSMPNTERGSILLSVVVAISLLAAITFMLNFQGAGQASRVGGELERDRLRYIAEAGIAHGKLQLARNTSCAGYADIPKTDFGGDNYAVAFSTNKESPVKIAATAELLGGETLNLQSHSVRAYQPPVAIALQLSKTGGKDAILDDFYPKRNYGGSNYVQINSASWQQRPVLQFDLSSVPAGVKIVSAQLELIQQSVNNAGAVAVHRMTRDWVEGTRNGGGTSDGADWQTHDGISSWAQLGGEFDATVYGVAQVTSTESGSWVAWDISDLVREWVSGTSPNYGLLLTGDGTVTGAKYASNDTSDPSQAPKLTIVYACECGKVCGGAPPIVTDGWAVGDSGSIYYTADAGTTWTPQTSGTSQALYSVNFPTPLVGYAAGVGEVLLKTTDGGNTWNTLSTGTWSLWGLAFLDVNTGYQAGLGPTLRMTTDGGSNWVNQDPVTTQNLRDIDFVEPSTGYFAGLGGVIGKTTNGGTDWSLQNSTVTTALYGIDFADAATGWATGDLGVIVKTASGGATWSAQSSGTTQKLQSVVAIDPSTAIAVGRGGLILKSTDGGGSWIAQTSGTTGDLWNVHFADNKNGYAAGQNGEILKTTDGGTTWAVSNLGTSVTMRAVYFANSGAGGSELGPLAHWKLDDGTGTNAIDSEGGHDGTLTNGPIWVAGKLGGGLDFDGVDDIASVGAPAALDDVFNGGGTVTAWIRPRGPGANNAGRVVDKWINNTNGWLFTLYNDSLLVQRGFSAAWGTWHTAAGSIQMDTWQHVAVVYDDSSDANDPVLYIDGIAQALTELYTPSGASGSDAGINLNIGDRTVGTTRRTFDGILDDVRVYDRALSAAEIEELATPPATFCDADYIADTKVSEFSTSAYGSNNIQGLTHLPEGKSFNGVPAPSGGAWISVNYSDGKLFMSDMAGTYLTELSSSNGAPTGVTYVASGTWSEHLAMVDQSVAEIQFIDLAGTQVSSFSTISVGSAVATDVAFIGATAGGIYDDHLAIVDSNADKVFLVTQAGSLVHDFDTSAFSTKTTGGAHIPGSDKLLLVDWDETVFVVDFAGTVLRQYASTPFGMTAPEAVAINPLSCDHVVGDDSPDLVVTLNQSGGGGGGGGGSCDGPFSDDFSTLDYSGGTANWATNWEETGETTNPSAGDIQIATDISNYQLMVRDDGQKVWREADLSSATSATLSFDYRRQNLVNSNDYVAVEVSYDGGSNWAELDRFTGTATDATYTNTSYPLDAGQLSATTRIRFRTPNNGMTDSNMVWFDNIQITCTP